MPVPDVVRKRLVSAAAGMPWRVAARAALGAESPLYRRLTDPVRSDFIHALPWDQIRLALDVGSEFGAIACDLSLYAEKVIAVAFDKIQADFIRLRAKQDNLPLTSILAAKGALPFAPASFDLITIEYDGWWRRPRSEEKWLRALRDLLREGGHLCVLAGRGRGQGNRWSLWAALSYAGRGLTLSRPKKIFSRAGFAVVEIFGVAPSVHQQRLIYDADDHPVRQYAQARFNPPVSRLGWVRRMLTDSRALYMLFERHLLILARKDNGKGGDLFWKNGAGAASPVVKLNTSSKVIVISFMDKTPSALFEVQKAGPAASREGVKLAHRIVQQLQDFHGRNVIKWPMRWPLPLEIRRVGGREFCEYEYVTGNEIAQLLLPPRFDSDIVIPLISRAMRDYLSLSQHIDLLSQQDMRESGWAVWYDRLARSEIDSQIRATAIVALERAKVRGCPLGAVHGDLSATNLVLSSSGQLVLLDWEHFDAAFMPAIDLIRFSFDALSDADLLPRRKRAALVCHVRHELSTLLSELGFSSREDRKYMRALYVAHQLIAGAALDDPGRVLARYMAEGNSCPFE